MKQRNEKEKKTGKNPRGKAPKTPSEKPNDKDQYNLTDPESRIMKTSKGFDQCFNGQETVNDDMIIVGVYSNSHCNDKQELTPTIESVPEALSLKISTADADTGYFSENNIADCGEKGIEAIISTAREKHNSFLMILFRMNFRHWKGKHQ